MTEIDAPPASADLAAEEDDAATVPPHVIVIKLVQDDGKVVVSLQPVGVSDLEVSTLLRLGAKEADRQVIG